MTLHVSRRVVQHSAERSVDRVPKMVTKMSVPASLLFIMVILPRQPVMSGYQQIRTQMAEVNFNGKLKKQSA